MESYFFIPAAKEEFVRNTERIPADYFVFDFEDSINTDKLDDAITIASKIAIQPNFYSRFYWNEDDADKCFYYIGKLIHLGFRNFFIPKFRTQDELAKVYDFLRSFDQFEQFRIALLIENPQALVGLQSILSNFRPVAVALGSHDYCAEMGMLHSWENIQWARNYLLHLAKALSVSCIDVASMNIRNKSEFEYECRDAFNKGFDAKLLIHPIQLEVFKNAKYYSEEELNTALELKKFIEQIGGIQNFTILSLNGTVIEKPHLNRYLKILKMANYDSFQLG